MTSNIQHAIENQYLPTLSGFPALEGALAPARRGLRVFPVHSPIFSPDGQLLGCSCERPDCSQVGKHSRIKGYPDLATTDQDRIRNWARKWPGTNFGILMDGVFGLDPDARNGGDVSLQALESVYGPLTETFTIRSGSGGLNRIYKVPPGLSIKNSASKIAKGIDIRGPASNGLLVAPGSLHHSGNRYELAVDMDPVEAPDWLIQLILRTDRERSKELPEIILNGQRNTVLASLAGAMRRYGLTADEMLPSMEAVSERFEEPLPDGEIEQVARSIERYPPDELSQASQSLIVAGTFGTPARRLQAVSFSGRDRPGPQTWAVQGLIPERHATILYGEGGTAKSVLAMHLGISIAAGFEKWMGFDLSQASQLYKGTGTVGTPVLYLDFELDDEDQYRRAFSLSQAMGLDDVPEQFWYMSAVGFGTDQAIREALKTCMDHGVKLLILDSAGLAMEGDSELSKDVLAFFRKYIEPLKAAGITVLIIDHQSKPQKGERYGDKWAFGSAYKTYSARSTIQVSATQDKNVVTATLTHRKVNFGPKQPPFSVRLVFGEDWIEVERLEEAQDVSPPAPETAVDKILNALRNGPMYPAQIVEATGLEPKTVRNRVSDLRKASKVVNTGNREGGAYEIQLTPKADLEVLMGGKGDDDSEAAA
jgi:hypothetical protein